MSQLPDVDCSRGAPMGRSSFGQPEGEAELIKVSLLDGGYDDGGAYWGTPDDLWCLRGDGFQQFLRALGREEAIRQFEDAFTMGWIISEKRDYDAFKNGYIAALYFTDTGDVDQPEEWESLTESCLAQIEIDCRRFFDTNGHLLPQGFEERAGMCFWYDRNGHGCGFYDERKALGRETADGLHAMAWVYPEFDPEFE